MAGPSEARGRLKRETDDLHRAAEAAFDRADWLGSPASYGLLLERWAGLLGFLAREYAPFLDEQEWAAAVGDRLQRLASDRRPLDSHGSGDPAPPPPAPAPFLGSVAEAFGSLYVLEGSALGGRILAKRVHDRLGPAMPTAFLDGAGARTGPAWLSFLGRLDQALATPAAIDGAVAGARRTFTLVETWLGTPDPTRPWDG